MGISRQKSMTSQNGRQTASRETRPHPSGRLQPTTSMTSSRPVYRSQTISLLHRPPTAHRSVCHTPTPTSNLNRQHRSRWDLRQPSSTTASVLTLHTIRPPPPSLRNRWKWWKPITIILANVSQAAARREPSMHIQSASCR